MRSVGTGENGSDQGDAIDVPIGRLVELFAEHIRIDLLIAKRATQRRRERVLERAPHVRQERIRSHRYLKGPGPFRSAGAAEVDQPDVVAVQLNLLGSHDAPRMRTILGEDDAGVRLAIANSYSLRRYM